MRARFTILQQRFLVVLYSISNRFLDAFWSLKFHFAKSKNVTFHKHLFRFRKKVQAIVVQIHIGKYSFLRTLGEVAQELELFL